MCDKINNNQVVINGRDSYTLDMSELLLGSLELAYINTAFDGLLVVYQRQVSLDFLDVTYIGRWLFFFSIDEISVAFALFLISRPRSFSIA